MSDIIHRPQPIIRPVTAADRDAVVQLVDGVYREYGDTICPSGADSDLTSLPQSYADVGGEFVVLEQQRQVIGSHAVLPLNPPHVCTFRRLYLAPEWRGTGCGRLLMDWALEWAAGAGFRRVEFWSDTRFHRGHAFFRRLGFESDGTVRELHDAWEPYREYFFFRSL